LRLSSHDDGVSSIRVAIPACLERNAAAVLRHDLRQNVAARCCSCPLVACCSSQRSPRDTVQFHTPMARLSQCARDRVRRRRVGWRTSRGSLHVSCATSLDGPRRLVVFQIGHADVTGIGRRPWRRAGRRLEPRAVARTGHPRSRPPVVEPAGRPLLAALRCGPAIRRGPRPQLSPARYQEPHP
jgi:hypothetical protein